MLEETGLRGGLGAAALALTSGVHAGGLFLPVGSADAAPRSIEVDPDVTEWRVRVARQELRAVRDDAENGGAGRLLLNVADVADLDVQDSLLANMSTVRRISASQKFQLGNHIQTTATQT